MTRQTKRYWKTLIYHLMDIAATNAFIIHKFYKLEGKNTTTESLQRPAHCTDYSQIWSPPPKCGSPASMQYRVYHGSKSFSLQERTWCVICAQKTIHKCPDCPSRQLCVSHLEEIVTDSGTQQCDSYRRRWFIQKRARTCQTQEEAPSASSVQSKHHAGRPEGSNSKRKRQSY